MPLRAIGATLARTAAHIAVEVSDSDITAACGCAWARNLRDDGAKTRDETTAELELGVAHVPLHQHLSALGELRGEERGEVLLDEREDEHVAHGRQRRDEDGGEQRECEQVARRAPQREHLALLQRGALREPKQCGQCSEQRPLKLLPSPAVGANGSQCDFSLDWEVGTW
jgi:hypothetical protein